MKTVADWLDTIAQTYEVKNQSALARLLSVTRSSISQNREGRHAINTTTALKIADLLGVNPMLVISSTMCEQEHKQENKALWVKAYEIAQQHERRAPSKRTKSTPRAARQPTYIPPASWPDPS